MSMKTTSSFHANDNMHFELQLKGSGRTPYARPLADGRASLKACIREFLASEYMAAIGIPTTRALGLVGGSTGVYRDKGLEAGGMVARVAPTFVRFGSFELFWYRGEMDNLRQLADYIITFHYPDLDSRNEVLQVTHRTAKVPVISILGNALKPESELDPAEHEAVTKGMGGGLIGPYTDETTVEIELNRYAKMFQEVVKRTARLCAEWQAAGFIHGVLNTDNMSVHGITLDYGPFLFMDTYDPCLCSSATDIMGRYRFENQPRIVHWNLSKFGRTLVDLVELNEINELGSPMHGVDGKDIVERILESYETVFLDTFTDLMGKKLGLLSPESSDLELLIEPLLQLLSDTDTDYTSFLRALGQIRLTESDFKSELGAPMSDTTVAQFVTVPQFHEKQQELLKIKAAAKEGSFDLDALIAVDLHAEDVNASLVTAQAENSKFINDKNPSGCFDMLVSSMKQGMAETEHEIEVMEFMNDRPAEPVKRKSVVGTGVKEVKLVEPPLESMEEEGGEMVGNEGDVNTLNEEEDLFPLVDILVAEDVHNPHANKKKSTRRASVIVSERHKRSSIATRGSVATRNSIIATGPNPRASISAMRMSITEKTSLRMDAVKFKMPEDPTATTVNPTQSDDQQHEPAAAAGPTQVSELFPGEHDLTQRWQTWLTQYRTRLILETITTHPEVPLSEQVLRNEDAQRRARMRKRNPRFSLRGWILEEVAEKVAGMTECQPVDAEIMRLQEELKILAEAEARTLSAEVKEDELDVELQELLARLKRGEPIKAKEDPAKMVHKSGASKLTSQGVEVMNQALRILVADSRRLLAPQHHRRQFSSLIDGFSSVFVALHSAPVSLPWFGAIAAGTVLFRLAFTLPVAIVQRERVLRMSKIQPVLRAWESTYKRTLINRQGGPFADPDASSLALQKQFKAKTDQLYKQHNCNPTATFLLPWVQVPLFLSVSLAVRRLAGLPPVFGLGAGAAVDGVGVDAVAGQSLDVISGSVGAAAVSDVTAGLTEIAARIPVDGFTTEGFMWFLDLSTPDPTVLLPLIIGGLHLANIQTHTSAVAKPTPRQRAFKLLFQSVAVLMVPVATQFPAVEFHFLIFP
ncbi:hypothetical protein HDU98_011428 [Podochytrium sp. JEL0797]|nr:hypothetical protein HDU98_011428 [Podochytrium sp. JEL0797]